VRWFHDSLPAPPGAGKPEKPQQPKTPGSNKPKPANPTELTGDFFAGGKVKLLENVHYKFHKTQLCSSGPRKGLPVRIFMPSDMPCPFAKGNTDAQGHTRTNDTCRSFSSKGTCWRFHPDAPVVTGKRYTMPPLE
jgi:hypothetical protein